MSSSSCPFIEFFASVFYKRICRENFGIIFISYFYVIRTTIIIYISFAEGFMRFLLVVVAGIIGALISIWFVGFGYTEREFVKKMIFVKSNI